MKKRHSIHLLLAAAALLLATAACTKDELADGDRLPEGQYPLEIARITLGVEGGEAQPWGAPQTRVSETVDGTGSVFDAGDPFAVQIDDGTETATYTVQDDGTATSDAPLYWTNTTPNRTVSAWYPATDGTLDLGDQSQSLAYLLSGSGTGDYQTPVTLTFTHQLAKVRVTPIGDALDEVTSLQLYTYTRCTYEKGEVVQGSQEDWIEMMKCEYTENGNAITCWEANVVPGYEITKLRANGTEERNLSAAITPEAGKFYDITLDKDKGYTDDGQGNYIVTTAEGLKAVADIANNGNLGINITLTENINLTDMEWTPIGTNYNNAYTGIFDGNGKTITGLTVTGSDQYAGLFGRIGSGGTVKNVVLEGVQITSDNSLGSVGGVAGYSYGNIEYCSVSGSVSVSGISDVGGVVGYQVGGSITGCSSSATVKGTQRAGGVAGATNSGAILTACYATGSVTLVSNNDIGTYFAGGVVGSNGGSCIQACYAWGSVTGSGSGTIYVGGVTGTNDVGTLTACYHAKGTVKGSDGATGGVAGRNFKDSMLGSGIITACYWGSNGQIQGIGEDQVGTGGTTQVTDGNWSGAKDAMNDALTAENESWRYQINLVNSLLELVQNQ
ncbi:GLUG motif-containing protein [Phocaeicola salanitronis]|uniref:GLUG motif-containing protein n=1 Tax=Phocaeicola salanitronis TaxID=376805 RepID=UPI003D189FBC